MVSSPAKKVEAARERDMESGVLPKKEMVEEDELEEEEAEGALPLLLPMGVVMVIVMMEGCRARSIRSSHSWSMSNAKKCQQCPC